MSRGWGRRVIRSPEFVRVAQSYFPPGGSVDGTPSFEVFVEHILEPVEFLARQDFERWSGDVGGIRFYDLGAAGPFPPIVLYARLTSGDEVELLDLDVDTDYWELLETDPDD